MSALILPPLSYTSPSMDPPRQRSIDNSPIWLSQRRDNNRKGETFDLNIPSDAPITKGRMWVFTAQVLTIPAAEYSPPMPVDVDNGLPGIKL